MRAFQRWYRCADIDLRITQLSTRLLLSMSLASDPSLAFAHLNTVLDSVLSDVSDISNRLSLFSAGLPLNPTDFEDKPERCCVGHIRNCLVILDAYLLQNRAGDEDAVLSKGELYDRYPWLAEKLIALITVAEILARSDASESVKARCAYLSSRRFVGPDRLYSLRLYRPLVSCPHQSNGREPPMVQGRCFRPLRHPNDNSSRVVFAIHCHVPVLKEGFARG